MKYSSDSRKIPSSYICRSKKEGEQCVHCGFINRNTAMCHLTLNKYRRSEDESAWLSTGYEKDPATIGEYASFD